MFITLTNTDLIEIGKRALEDKEWISYIKEYPNLRGVFDSHWGPIDDPGLQLETFKKQFLTEEQIYSLSKIWNKSWGDIFGIRDDVNIEDLQYALELFEEYFEDDDDVSLDILDEAISTILTDKIFPNLEKILESEDDQYIRKDMVDEFHEILLNLSNYDNINEIYDKTYFCYTREFVEFYLRHVKTLSRSDIFKICKEIGDEIKITLTHEIDKQNDVTVFDYQNILFYTLPRGGLEVLGLFLYANEIGKNVVPIFTHCYFPADVIIDKLKELRAHPNIKERLDALIQDIESIRDWTDKHKIYEEQSVFGRAIKHEDIDYIFLIDDYFASGENLWLLYEKLYEHFTDMPVEKIKALSIIKRRSLNIWPSKDLSTHGRDFYGILTTSYYGITTEDIKAIREMFPEIKRLMKGEITKITDIPLKLYYNYFGDINIKLDKNWLDNLTIACVFPHSIADGETETILRHLYGDRFRHSTRDKLSLIARIVGLMKIKCEGDII